MRIALIVPTYVGSVKSIHPPLGLIALRSILKSHAAVTILDGVSACGRSIEFLNKFDAVGIQVHALNVEQCVWIGRELRQAGIHVVIGGPEVSLASKYDWIAGGFDVAVRGHISERIVSAFFPSEVRGASRIVAGERTYSGPLDYEGINWDVYWQRARALGLKGRHAPVFTHLGCSFRDRTRGGCSFCADLGDLTLVREPGVLQKELDALALKEGVDFFYCVGENLAKGMAKRLSRTVKTPAGGSWSFFTRADEIDKDSARLLRQFGVSEIRLGAESGDASLLRATAKGQSLSQVESAVNLLEDVGISVTLSFVLGLPGESHETLARTVEAARLWCDKFHMLSVSASIIQPIAGSVLGRLAGVSAGQGKSRELRESFISRFSTLTLANVQTACSQINSSCRLAPAERTMVNGPWSISQSRNRSPAVVLADS